MTLLFGKRKNFKNEMRNVNLLTLILIIVFPENKKSYTHTHTQFSGLSLLDQGTDRI